jgi:predicted DCC family thiol-disulfide oxidoreductase YuxK
MRNPKKIIIFDGICGLCNKSVDILIKLDKEKKFLYTSLQGEFIKTLNSEPRMDSIIYYEEGNLFYKSTAILKILRSLGGIWVFANIFYIIPRTIRDFLYDLVAKHRYKLFGKMESCRMPNKEEEALFID